MSKIEARPYRNKKNVYVLSGCLEGVCVELIRIEAGYRLQTVHPSGWNPELQPIINIVVDVETKAQGEKQLLNLLQAITKN